MLIEIKQYIQEQGDARLDDLCAKFHVSDQEAMRDMLQVLINKGLVRLQQESERGCSKCNQCPRLSNSDIYEWVK